MSDAARQRVAEAMKPRGRRAPTPPPEEDDPLMEMSAAEDKADDTTVWKHDAETRAKVKEFQTLRVARIRQLCGAGLQSTDPRVSAIAGQVDALNAVIKSMGGKS